MTYLDYAKPLIEELLSGSPSPEAIAFARGRLREFANTMEPETLGYAIAAIVNLVDRIDEVVQGIADSN